MKFQKYAGVCLLIVVWASLAAGQSTESSSSSNDVGSTATAKSAKSALLIPPEKASPVHITRFATAPVIDGKLGDEVWKSAAVFKDFY